MVVLSTWSERRKWRKTKGSGCGREIAVEGGGRLCIRFI